MLKFFVKYINIGITYINKKKKIVFGRLNKFLIVKQKICAYYCAYLFSRNNHSIN